MNKKFVYQVGNNKKDRDRCLFFDSIKFYAVHGSPHDAIMSLFA